MNFFWHLLFLIGSWIPLALTYTFLFGKGKILHFGPGGVSLIAAYGTFVTLMHTGNYPLALFTGLLCALLLSAIFAWLSLRLEPDGFGVMSIAVHLAILSVVLNWSSLTRGALGIPRIPRAPFPESIEGCALTMLGITVLCILAMYWIDRSRLGREIAALAEHPWHAAALGINRTKVHFIAFFLGAIAAVLGTVPFTQYILLLHPNDYQFPLLIFAVTIVVAGKPGSILGATFATILLVSLREAIRFIPLPADILGPLRLMLFGLILFAAVWWRRDSLFPKQRTI